MVPPPGIRRTRKFVDDLIQCTLKVPNKWRVISSTLEPVRNVHVIPRSRCEYRYFPYGAAEFS